MKMIFKGILKLFIYRGMRQNERNNALVNDRRNELHHFHDMPEI